MIGLTGFSISSWSMKNKSFLIPFTFGYRKTLEWSLSSEYNVGTRSWENKGFIRCWYSRVSYLKESKIKANDCSNEPNRSNKVKLASLEQQGHLSIHLAIIGSNNMKLFTIFWQRKHQSSNVIRLGVHCHPTQAIFTRSWWIGEKKRILALSNSDVILLKKWWEKSNANSPSNRQIIYYTQLLARQLSHFFLVFYTF